MGKVKRVVLEEQNGVIGKECTKCETWKSLDDYSRKSNGLGGRNCHCKSCRKIYKKKWDKENKKHNQSYYQTHKEHRNQYSAEWKIKNKERERKAKRKWDEKNRMKRRLAEQRRYALKEKLPCDLKLEQMEKLLKLFKGCALIESSESVHWDHVIPISTGHGGTIYGNIIPLSPKLNISKNNRNIFEWFSNNQERFGINQQKFNELIEHLSSANGMTVDEYRDYVYWCHANPRSVDDITNEKEVPAIV